MKTKPVKHKATNTFRFVPFADRINSIDIRHAALYHIEHAYTSHPQENETHFHLAVQKWHVLNLSENFKKFKKEVIGVITIQQLIHKKEEILDIIERYLNLEDQLCLQPLLEILVSLAKDLRNDFYPHFPKFLDILIKLLNTKDAERLEWSLICLAFLFKILKPNLKKDVEIILTRIVPLLSENYPQYINNFAAESFAFVARDIRDKNKFMQHILHYLLSNDQAVTGIGHLIFEILKGVGNKFHSCAESFFPLLLQHLKENKMHQEILFKVLTQTLEDTLQSISPKEFTVFWSPVFKFIEDNFNEEYNNNKCLEYALRLTGQVIEHQNGKFLLNPQRFSILLVKVICEQSAEPVLEVCAQIGVLLLLSSNILLSQEHAGIIIKSLVPLPFPDVLINFVQNVIDYSQFELHILPAFLNFVVQSNFSDQAMNALTKICLAKSPLSINGLKLFEWVKYPLNFGKGLPLVMEYVENILNSNIESQISDPNRLINVLICLPHIEKLDVKLCSKKISKVIHCLLNILDSENYVDNSQSKKVQCNNSKTTKQSRLILFILANALECVVHISSCKGMKNICEIDKFLPVIVPCAADPNNLAALQLLDLYLTAYEQENGLQYAFLSLVDSYIRQNISSPFHIIRLLTTHIYKLFEKNEEFEKSVQVSGSTEKFAIFSKCFEVESIIPSIQEYRSQINILQKMTFNTTQYVLAKDTEYHLFALKYMLGVLYNNFKLLWEPVIEFIAGYGNALSAAEFWPPFYEALEFSFTNVNSNLSVFQFESEMNTNFKPLQDLYISYNNLLEKPDLYNYRNLLLKTMTQCIQVCEAKNKDVVVLFLKFIEDEYKRNNNMNALKVDIEVYKNSSMGIDDDADIENGDETEIYEELKQSDHDNNSGCGKIVFKTLINIMQVLAQFRNPRALHKESVFWEIYMDFLKHKNPGLQKFALDCILNYKNKNVLTYKSNLYNLVDDKKFKDELTNFKITEESTSIQPEDREHVIPIVLRILYGKMTSKLGADKKGGGQTKRSLVMRYLSGCKEDELRLFIEMAFSYFKEYMTMSSKEIYDHVLKNLDLKSVTYPGKMHSALNLFDVAREYFGGSMKDSLLSQLLKVLLTICSQIAGVLNNVERVHVSYVKVMKNLRTIAIGILGKLFDQFDKYNWSKEELFVIFETLIWPLVPKLHVEGVHSPTPLLKLFNIWCQNPRYYILLVTCSDSDTNLSVLPAIFKLLLAPKTSPGVLNLILDMIEKLLTLTKDEEEKEEPPIETFKSLDVNYDLPQEINFGSRILVPHLTSILDIMKRRVANNAKSNTVNKRDLLILSRVTELITIPEMCDELLDLLLPILIKKVCLNMAEENMEHAVSIIINLLGHSATPQRYIKHCAVLFNKVSPVEVRKLLIRLLSSIAENMTENKETFLKIAFIITEMNAYNKRWIEQPDFDRRLNAYKEIYKMADGNEISVDLAILIVNNCFFFIRTEKDIGLRDSAALCLKRILPKFLLKNWSTTDGQFLVKDTVLSLISNGIRDNANENLRTESVSLLGVLARECPEVNVVLSDLSHFANKEDPEVDFFENICHLQLHRRVRALLKFSKIARKMIKCPSPRTLTNFILPLASVYVCDDKYMDKNSLIDACIEAISTCCRLLPWYHYEVILKFYLNKLRHSSEYQKQLTRILVGIVDSFHFDFSKVPNIELPKALLTNFNTGKPKESKLVKKEDVKENIEGNDESDSEIQDAEMINDIETDLQIADKIEESDEKTSKEVVDVPAFERVTSVSPSVANRIIKSLTSGLLPQLNRAIGKMTSHEESHKLNRRRTGFIRQEEDMVRVPIALALVKLLQRLPSEILRHQLPGIIIKLCSFLKSPLKQVRIIAKDIVKKIMSAVGTSYLGILLEHLTLLLTRGFQVHVLVATIHSVLDVLKAEFKCGDLDDKLHYILDVCVNDLFGALSEEKEVEKLHYKTPEAKPSKKSYVTLMIVSQNISEKSLIKLLLPFKEVLQKHHSKKIVLKVQEALMHISSGLVTNKYVDNESLFVFLHGIASESIPEFVLGAPKREISDSQKENMLRAKPDCFIIPATPKRNKESQALLVKSSNKTNAHVLVEFSLNILYVILKREKVPRMECRAFVDPLIPLLVDSLKSDHVKVATVALKCITTLWTVRINTQTLEEMIQDIVKTIFLMLHKYATFQISKQNDNYHLVRSCFKAVTVLIRNVKYYKLEVDQLKTLLLYAEEDCQSDEKQANSFSLLNAILERRLVSPELHEVMEKVSKICILSESAKSRDEARAMFLNYLTNYTIGKRMEKYIHFFVTQLNYELQHGRESSLKFILMIIKKLNVAQLIKQGDYVFLALGACMLNDSAPECRASAAGCIEAMLKKFPALERNKLFDLVLALFEDKQPVHFELAAQLATRFVNIEGEEFKGRLSTILPSVCSKMLFISNDITEGRFVKIRLDKGDKMDEEKQKEKDHSLVQMLNLIEKITIQCPSSLKINKYSNDYDDIGQQCQALLAYPHAWVRLKSVQILRRILLSVDPEELDMIVKKKSDSERGFIYNETEVCLKSLVLDLCAQYTPSVSKDMADHVTDVMFVIFKLVYSMSSFKLNDRVESEVEPEADVDSLATINIRWILFKLRRAVNVEVTKSPKYMDIRRAIFTMWLHVISYIELGDLNKVIDVLIPPIVRELSTGDASTPATLAKQLAGRLGKKLRNKIGDIEFSKLMAEAQTRLNMRRAERKKVILQEKVLNPEKAAKRKLQLKEKKKQAKRTKLDVVYGKKTKARKRKAEDIDIEEKLFQDD